MVARLSLRARAMPARSPFTKVMPPLSIATSVPVPIAMPTSAWASAGASLMPSPAMATLRPSFCRSRTTSNFFSGKTSASNSSMPRLLATASAVARLSPVSMTRRIPSVLRLRTACTAKGLTGSAMPISPAAWPSIATKTTVCPCRRSSSAFCFSPATEMPLSSTNRSLPTRTCRSSIWAVTPNPVREWKSRAFPKIKLRSLAVRTIPFPRGCSLPCSTMAARRNSSFSVWFQLGSGTIDITRGLPSVSVPVLSTTRVSTFSNVSRASAFFIRTPA